MEISHNEVILLLSGNEFLNEQVEAHSRSMSIPVNVQKQAEFEVSSTIYSLILENSDHDPRELLDNTKPEYKQEVEGKELNETAWAQILQKHPELLETPIAVRGERVVICDSPSKIHELDKT